MHECQRGNYVITTDRSKLDLQVIHSYLSESSYWAQGRSFATVVRSVENSLCFGLYAGEKQVGFARVVTDYATFAWLCDVFVLESHRHQGLGKWLVECIVSHPELQSLRLFLLATSNAHELYHRYGGFGALQAPGKWMQRSQPRSEQPEV